MAKIKLQNTSLHGIIFNKRRRTYQDLASQADLKTENEI